jgi:signal transduction histidine kinase/CheY-like chemotaxis protein
MKYLLEVLLLILFWWMGSLAIDRYSELNTYQKELALKSELNRFTTELSLETLSATDSNVYHFDKHAQKVLRFESISHELSLNNALSLETQEALKRFHELVNSYMQLASMLKTSFKYISKLELEKRSFSDSNQALISSVIALASNLQVAHELALIEAVHEGLNQLLPQLKQIESQDNRLRVLRLHIQFILGNSLKASNLLMPIQEGRASAILIKNIEEVNALIETSFWSLIRYSLLTLVAASLLIALVLVRLLISLKEANVKANQAAETKSMFLSNMSHEIRTPMNGVLGLTDILLNTDLNPTQRNYLEKIRFSANALTTIINDILDFSKIESKQLNIEYSAFQFEKLLDNLRTLIGPAANSKGVQLIFDVSPDLHDFYMGDSVRINQILLNLCSNAIKFTKEGNVTVALNVESVAAERDAITLSVTDTGIGIEQHKIDKLFERFTQAESSTTRKYGGTGLGLTICKLLTELMGGEMCVESTFGKGSTFSVRIELDIAQESKPSIAPDMSFSVLIVEDDPANLEINKQLVSSLGCEVVAVESGTEAINTLASQSFDILLLDWVLKDIQGIELLDHLKDKGLLPEQVIICTAHSEQLISSDTCYPVLQKPLIKKDLIEAFVTVDSDNGSNPDGDVTHASARDNEADSKETSDTKDLTRMSCLKVLLVEDNEINKMIAVTLLEGMGLDVLTAANGQEAVDLVEQHEGLFDLVLMDIQMPVMDGIQATRILRQQYSGNELKIIALTANVMADEVDEYLSIGMNGHLGKPFELPDLEAVIAEHATPVKH